MACNNHPSEKDIEEIEQEANRQAEDVRQVPTSDTSAQQFAVQCAKDVEEYARQQVQFAQLSGKPLSTSEVAAIKSKIDQFAKDKAEEVRQYERQQSEAKQAAHERPDWVRTRYTETEPNYRNGDWHDPTPRNSFIGRAGRRHDDWVPDFNPNPDADTIPGFHSGFYENDNGFGIVMKDDNEPGRSTHIHYTKDGIILSTFNSKTGTIDRFNLTKGKDQTGKGEGTEWPSD